MADSTGTLTALRDELQTRGLVRRPYVAGSLPPLHVEPTAPPAPGDREEPETTGRLVVTARLSGELAEETFDAYRRRIVVDVIYRSKGTDGLVLGRGLDAQVRKALTQRPDYGLGWTMGGIAPASAVFVLSSSVYGGLSPIETSPDGVRTELAKYLLEVLVS